MGDAEASGGAEALDLLRHAVIRTVGLEGWRKLQDEFGGMPRYVPRVPTERSWLWLAFGETAATAICRSLWQSDGDGRPIPYPRVAVPRGMKTHQGRIREHVAQLLLSGVAVGEVARQSGSTARTVWRVRKELVDAGRLAPGGGKRTQPPVARAPDPQRDERIAEMLLSGRSIEQAVRRSGASRAEVVRVRARMVEAGRLKPRPPPKPIDAEHVARLLSEGLPVREIVARTGASDSTIYHIRKTMIAAGKIKKPELPA